MSIHVQLPDFEGPLGLLLYLIRKEEMDIMNIDVHTITGQYLDYIKLMKELDLEVAGEFISMASTLIHIKSKMLLPQYNENGEIVDQEDPRKELVQKLLEYQKYQEAAKLLNDRAWVGRDVWLRGQRESLRPPEEALIVEDNALYSLIAIYRHLMKSAKKRVHKVGEKIQSIAQRILEIKDRLVMGQKIALRELIESTAEQSMYQQMRQTLITFLSLLELGKMNLVSLYQSETYSDIWIEAKRPIDHEMISRVEEYDALNADEIAANMIAKVIPVDNLTEDINGSEVEDADLDPGISIEVQASTDSEDLFLLEDLATDEEILAAEAELEKDGTHV